MVRIKPEKGYKAGLDPEVVETWYKAEGNTHHGIAFAAHHHAAQATVLAAEMVPQRYQPGNRLAYCHQE